MNNLTGILQQIADVTSVEVASILAKEVGGTELFVPRYPKPACKLSKIVGQQAAETIAKEVGWGDILIPAGEFRGQGARKKAVKQLCEEGLSTQEIARRTDCHERTVRRIKGRLRNDLKQLTLPGM